MSQQPGGQILSTETRTGARKLEVRLEDETAWINQRQLTELFDKTKGLTASTSSTSSKTMN